MYPFLKCTCQIDKGRIGKTGHNKDKIACTGDGNQRLRIVCTEECRSEEHTSELQSQR